MALWIERYQMVDLIKWSSFFTPSSITRLKAPKLIIETDLCVKCGLCLPYCPTYNKTLDENESPRGRISLIQGWSSGALTDTRAVQGHLDNCLVCRSCENVCPAQVPYAKILDQFKAAAGEGKKPIGIRLNSAISRFVLINKKRSDFFKRLANVSRFSKLLGAFSSRFATAQRLQSFINDLKPGPGLKTIYPTHREKEGCVGLFIGCTGELFDRDAIDASIRILNHLGFDVAIAPNQICCGALDLHSGETDRASDFAATNLRAFDQRDLDAIVTVATGCGATLSEYTSYYPDSEGFSSKVVDICQFVNNCKGFEDITLDELDAKLLIHTPCSLANVLKTVEAPKTLMKSIPKSKVSVFTQSGCCGAAGNYMLEHPNMADALRNDLIMVVKNEKPDYLLTTNIGCALHLRAGLRQQCIDTEVLHPIVLLNRRIRVIG